MKMLTYILIVAVPSIGLAGNKVGNGGDVMICTAKAKDGARTRLLDFFEAEERGTKLAAAGPKASYTEILKAKLEKLRKIAPKLAAQYQRRLEKIEGDLEFKTGVALTDVQDSLHAYKPNDEACDVKQIVIRTERLEASDKLFLVDKLLWAKLDNRDQAGLISHEIIYEHFSKIGSDDSRKARRLNALIFSEDFEKMSEGKFWLFIKDLALPIYP